MRAATNTQGGLSARVAVLVCLACVLWSSHACTTVTSRGPLAYDAFGNVTSETQAAAAMPKTFTYTWDACGTLHECNWPDAGAGGGRLSFTYVYDLLDNTKEIWQA
jgi:YD repeat-containing protein